MGVKGTSVVFTSDDESADFVRSAGLSYGFHYLCTFHLSSAAIHPSLALSRCANSVFNTISRAGEGHDDSSRHTVTYNGDDDDVDIQ